MEMHASDVFVQQPCKSDCPSDLICEQACVPGISGYQTSSFHFKYVLYIAFHTKSSVQDHPGGPGGEPIGLWLRAICNRGCVVSSYYQE